MALGLSAAGPGNGEPAVDQRTERGDETQETRVTDPVRRPGLGEPRLFGAVPPSLALAIGIVGLILGIALFATGSIVAGVIWALAALALLAIGIDSARRWPASALPRLLAGAGRATARGLGIARVSGTAWSDASWRRLRLRRELRRLRKRRAAEISVLGEAAYREDSEETKALRGRIAELDGRIEGCERAMSEAVARARDRVKRKRAEVQPTQPQSA
jgi:uncharacterized membrane protein